MTPERLQEIAGGGAVVYQSRALFRVSGSDRLRYLNGQLSNDIRLASERTVYGCVLDAKGRLQGEAFVHEGNEAHFLDAPACLKEALPARLDRYLVADDVEIELAGDWTLVHAYGRHPAADADPAPLPEDGISAPAARLCPRSEDGLAGRDYLLPPGETSIAWIAASLGAEGTRLDDEEAGLLAFLAGRPAWDRGLEEGRLLPEAGIEDFAVDYQKGCYVGQEVVSRMRSAGKRNWALVHLVAEGFAGDPAALKGCDLGVHGTDRTQGRIAFAALHPRLDRVVAFAYVRLPGANGDGATFHVPGSPGLPSIDEATFTIASSPLL